MAGCDTVIHLVGIIREQPATLSTFERIHTQGTLNVLDAAVATGVRRYVHMSSLGSRSNARSRYHKSKWAAEEAVRATPIPWTIFRPSIIYGRGDQFVSLLAHMVQRYPMVPVIGNGLQRLQPVPLEHVAAGFARAVALESTVKHAYDVVGPDPVTLLRLLDLIGEASGRARVRKMHVPLGLMRPMARLFHRLPGFPLTPDQLVMLEEDNVADPQPFLTTFGISPVPLAAGLRAMLG